MCAFVHGFQPYFYIEAPRGFGPDDCDSLCSQLNVRIPQSNIQRRVPTICCEDSQELSVKSTLSAGTRRCEQLLSLHLLQPNTNELCLCGTK